MTEHAYSTVFLVMSPETWASFDDETKETFKRVMAECSIEEREISRKMDSEAVAELEKQGMTVTYPDKQQFHRQGSRPVCCSGKNSMVI